MKIGFSLFGVMLMFSGCISNEYENHYAPYAPYRALMSQFPPCEKSEKIKLRPAISENDVLDVLERGYVPFGQSSFEGVHCPWFCAIDCAEEMGADLVLIDEKFKEKESYTSVLFLPTTSTTYSHGSVYGGGTHAHYSGSSITTSTQAVPIQKTREIYKQTALFFQKLDLKNYYGAILYVPPRLPTDTADTPCVVRVLAVLKGSQAEADGIKRGAMVRGINGRKISVRKDVAAFANNLRSIKSMEVCYE